MHMQSKWWNIFYYQGIFFFCAPKGINERRVEDERKKIKKNIMIEKEAKFSDYIFGKKNSW